MLLYARLHLRDIVNISYGGLVWNLSFCLLFVCTCFGSSVGADEKHVETLKPFQCVGVEWLASRKRALLADEPGLGKTAQAIVAAELIGAKSILVITKASLIHNWADEFDKWSLNFQPQVALPKRGYVNHDCITSYDNYWRHPERFNPAPDVLILDEAHAVKSVSSKRTKAIYGPGGVARHAKHVWALTGTPMRNDPTELYPHYMLLCEARHGRSDWPRDLMGFTRRFCITNKVYLAGRTVEKIVGSKNEEQLRGICDTFMLRRTKEQVMTELGKINYDTLTVMVEGVKHNAEYLAAESFLRDGGSAETLLPQEDSLAAYRRQLGVAKAQALMPILWERFVSGNDKVVLFAHHKDTVAALMKWLDDVLVEGYAVSITGDTPNTVRHEAVGKFQNDPACRVFVGSITAAGEGITLTAAHDVVIVEPSWVPADNAQAISRCHRIGQKKPVFAYFVVAYADRVDKLVTKALISKSAMINKVME